MITINEYCTNLVLYHFLVESAGLPKEEYENLYEEFRVDTVKELASSILGNIKTKLSGIDTSSIDRSRGDIKNYPFLQNIQSAVSRFQALAIEGNYDDITDALSTITNTLNELSKDAPEFKEAYRDKKTLLILKYQGLILAILASLSYMVTECIEIGSDGQPKIKAEHDLSSIEPLKWLTKAVGSGIVSNIKEEQDINSIRRFYAEYSPEEFSTIYEAVDVAALLGKGLDAFTYKINHNTQLSNILYKFAGAVMLILSLRDIFYTLSAYKKQVSDFVGNISNFLSVGKEKLGQLTRFLNFNQKAAQEVPVANQKVAQEIAGENHEILQKAQQDASNTIPSPSVFKPIESQAVSDSELEKKDDTSNASTPSSITGFDF